MPQIRNLDLAWEAINALGEASRKALIELERAGAKAPERNVDAVATTKSVLDRHSVDCIADFITKATASTRGGVGSMPALIDAFMRSERYQKLSRKTKANYELQYRRMRRDVGEVLLEDVTLDHVKAWHARWSANGKHLPMGLAMMNFLRILFAFGSVTCGNQDCSRLSVATRVFRVKPGKGRGEAKRINATQAIAFRREAHRLKVPSQALTVALCLEAKLAQRTVIGDWLPLADPTPSGLVHDDQKWVGLDWSQVDASRLLRLKIGTDDAEIDLNDLPMVTEELNKIGKLPEAGPMIVWEHTSLPYTAPQFRTMWRAVADGAGIPKDVFNIRHQFDHWQTKPRDPRKEAWEKVTAVCRRRQTRRHQSPYRSAAR